MAGCNACPPCFIKKTNCGLCINCLRNSKGNRVHRKCRRRICLKDRKKQTVKRIDKKAEKKYSKQLKTVSKKLNTAKKVVKKATICKNTEKFSTQLKNVLSGLNKPK